MLEELNKQLQQIVENIEYYSEDFFGLADSFNEITLNNKFNKTISDKTKKYIEHNSKEIPISKSIKIAREFLIDVFPPNYIEMFDEAINKNYFVFEENDYASMFFNNEGKPTILINYQKNIYDVCLIIHEFLHYTNSNSNVITQASDFVSETISFFSEYVVLDYMKDKHPKYSNEVEYFLNKEYEMFYQRAVWGKVLFSLVKHKMNGKEINEFRLEELYSTIDAEEDEIFVALETIFEIVSGEDIDGFTSLDAFLCHVIEYNVASVLSRLLYGMYKKNPKEAIEFNESVIANPYFGIFEALDYLDLDYEYLCYGPKTKDEVIELYDECPITVGLKKESIEQVEKVYKKNMKR